MVKAQGDISVIEKALYDHVNNAIDDFATRYDNWLKREIRIVPNNALSSFESLLTAVKQSGHRLYLLIDEYDNFANELMIGHHKETPSRYETLLSGEGIVKTLFKAVKSAGGGRDLERTFVTGVSPVVLSDMSSGYNVAIHIYLEPEFNELCGFQESEIQAALETIVTECQLSLKKAGEAFELMKTFYDGYCFNSLSTEFVYNPTLTLYFLSVFQRRCQFPNQLLDDNLGMDRGKLTYISLLPYGEQVIVQALNENPPLAITQLASGFGVSDMLIYVSLGKAGLTGEKAREMSYEEIKALPGVQQKFTEGKAQLLDYEKRLKSKYEEILPLHLISVVALGLERVVWEKVTSVGL